MENYHPHSRYRLVDKPGAYPGLDIIHNTPDGPVFDLGVDMDGKFGVGYIQVKDVEEMARVLGMIPRWEAQALKKRISQLEAEQETLPREVERLKDGLDILVNDFFGRLALQPELPIPALEKPAKSEPADSNKDNGESESTDSDDSGDNGQESGSVISEGTNELPSGSKYEALELFGFDLD